ncbi:MAG: imidazolonepropionase [Candidatus Izimaplasma sp.]|nr:imidazolonepropionase [Candidatus Izimaplasma bacterium]
MNADLIIHNIKTLYTSAGPYQQGEDMDKIVELHDAFIAIVDGNIAAVESGEFAGFVGKGTTLMDAQGLIAMPGFIDSHTHLVYGGSREGEFRQKLEGIPYLDILKQGGGILKSVEQTRASSFDELYQQSLKSLNILMSYGVTSLEIKSGYGLNLETEIKQLKVIKQLKEDTKLDIKATYLGAHAIPNEYKNKANDYLETVKSDLLTIKQENLADFVDIFCEDSVFDLEQSKDFLSYAKDLGFNLKIHADEIVSLGGGGLAAELKATSADHLMAVSDSDIKELAKSKTVTNLLPATSFYLNKTYANARKMIKEGCIVALSSDYNPGSSPSENFQFVMQLGANKLKMTPGEVLTAVTINAAKAINLEQSVGSLEVGKQADIVLLDAPNLPYVLYHYGINHTSKVIKNGKVIFEK